MQTFRNKLIGVAIVGVLAVMGTLMSSRQVVAQNPNAGSAPVHIVSPLPLPVSISGTPSISFANTASTPLFVQNQNEPAYTPYLTRIIGGSPVLPPVPVGKRLVIETVSVFLQQNDSTGYVRMSVNRSGQPSNDFYLPAPLISGSGGNYTFVGNFPFTTYVSPTDTVQFLTKGGIGLTGTISATVSGHLVDCSAPNSCATVVP